MATKNETAPKLQGSNKKGGLEGFMHGLLTVLLSLLIVLVVFGGAFYYVLKNNIYGIGEEFRPSLQRIPVIRLALPPLPETEDPYDPKYLTQNELITRYNQLRRIEAELSAQLKTADERISELEIEKEQWVQYKEEAQAIQAQNEVILEQIQERTIQLEKIRKELSVLIVNGDKEGFKEYYEAIDSETASQIYSEVVAEEAANAELKKLAKTYQEMRPANAAAVLTAMGEKDMPLLLDLMGLMDNKTKAEIIQNMDPEFAADLMLKMTDNKVTVTE